YRIYTAGRVRERGVFLPRGAGSTTTRTRWADMTEAERRSAPGDWEAQVGQGPITFHSEEHLETSDKGVVMGRRLLRRQLETIKAGGDPINVSHDAGAPPVVFEAGNFLRDAWLGGRGPPGFRPPRPGLALFLLGGGLWVLFSLRAPGPRRPVGGLVGGRGSPG